jgi:carboxymethylenebutenolidase
MLHEAPVSSSRQAEAEDRMGRMIELESGEAFPAYVAEPQGEVRGGLIVIHEIWGLVDHIKDVADRFAAEGYVVVAPDLLSHVGVDAHIGLELQKVMSSPDERVRSEGQPRLRQATSAMYAPEFAAWAVPALKRTVDLVAEQDGVDGRVGVVGFCFGGSYSFTLATVDDRIRAAVPFYGSPPPTADLGSIVGPVLAFYGERDQRILSTLPQVTEGMHDAGVDFRPHVYPGVGHAFFNDTNPRTYDAATADDAWQRTLAFLDEALNGAGPARSIPAAS